MAKSMKRNYQELPVGDAFGISILAQADPQDRRKIYNESLKKSLGAAGRALALKLLPPRHNSNSGEHANGHSHDTA